MNILDENIPDNQYFLLQGWGIRVYRIGDEIGRHGMADEDIMPLLHRKARVTFFTNDLRFYQRSFCHPGYAIVCLAMGKYEVASFVRLFLRHPLFDTHAKRRGKVFQVAHAGIRFLPPHGWEEGSARWVSGNF